MGGAPATASVLAVGAVLAIVGLLIPPSDGFGAGEGPRYVSKKDDVGGGISGGNWCGTAHKNSTMFEPTTSTGVVVTVTGKYLGTGA